MQHSQQSLVGASGGDPLDETGVCLLSLDGGGVRGLSTLLILKRLMERTNAERKNRGLDPVKPCELFDLIGGTSTGGLVAIMLGRLKMSVDECITVYTSMFEKIFEKRKHRLPISLGRNFGNIQPQFDSDILRNSIKEIVESRGLPETERFNAEGDRTCRVFVCAKSVEAGSTVPIRAYSLLDESNDDAATIVDAALATSAATTFFKPVTIGVRKYVDGALGSNNPVKTLWREAQNIWCPDDGRLEPMVKCFVSIGTGNPGLAPVRDDAKGFLTDTLVKLATETEHTADEAEALYRGLLDKKRYFRYNVQQGLQGVGLEEYRKQPEIEAATQKYLAFQTQKFSLRDCAQNLGIKQWPTPVDFRQGITAYDRERMAAKDTRSIPTTWFLGPPPSSEEFTGREWYMSRLEELMSESDKHTRVALYGLGGIGKTRIALEYAYGVKASTQRSVFWVHGATAQRLEKSYLDIAKEVNIVGWDSVDPNIDKLKLVKDWFESKISGQWMLIVDNADDIDLFYGERTNSTRLADYFPRPATGGILLTTRNKKVGIKFSSKNAIEVKALATEESIRLLQAKIDDNQEGNYSALASALQNVPLALVQAAAFITVETSSISAYLHLYNQSDAYRIQLLSEDFEDDIRDSDIKNPVATTFALSFEHIKRSDLLAADILAFMSMLDTQAIPTSLLPCSENSITFTKALGTLQAFSLIARTSQQGHNDQSFDLHRLVRLAMHNWLKINGELESHLESAMSAMVERFPYPNHGNREICNIYSPHALAILSFDVSKDSTEMQLSQAALQRKVSQYLNAKGEYSLAETISQRSLKTREKLLGKKHLHTLNSGNALAEAFRHQGKYKQAEKMNQDILEIIKEMVGKEHQHTLVSMNNLAIVWRHLGKYKEAEDMLREILEVEKKFLGKEHPSILTTMHNLAVVQIALGKTKEAEDMYRETLELRQGVLDEKHPKTLISMSSLARVSNLPGNPGKAGEIEHRTLKLKERVLSEENPEMLTRMESLATILGNRGKYEEAEKLGRQILEFKGKVLGREHPETLISMSNLGVALSSQGKDKEAEMLYRQTLELMERVLGEEHPGTLTSMNNLAEVLSNQRKFEEAEKVLRQILEMSSKASFREHPDTLLRLMSLGRALSGQGKYKEAEMLSRQTLEVMERVLGKEHPHTLTSMFLLATVLTHVKAYEEAENLYRQTLELRVNALGREHPDTLRTMDVMGDILGHLLKYKEAETIYRQAVELRGKVLGREHSSTLRSMHNLAYILAIQGEAYEEAEELYRQTLQLRVKVLGREHPDTINTGYYLAALFFNQERREEALAMSQATLEAEIKILGREHPDNIKLVKMLAFVLDSQGKKEEAKEMYQQVVEIQLKVLGSDNLETLTSRHNLAFFLAQQEQAYDEAEGMYRQVIELQIKVLGREHPLTVRTTTYLASFLVDQGRGEEAEAMFRQSLEVKAVGGGNSYAVPVTRNLALYLVAQGREKEAEEMHRQALEFGVKARGKTNPDTVDTVTALASFLDNQGRGEEADDLRNEHGLAWARTMTEAAGPPRRSLIQTSKVSGASPM